MDDFFYSPVVAKLINVMNFFLCIKILDVDEIVYEDEDIPHTQHTDNVVIADSIRDNTNIIHCGLPQEVLNDCISVADDNELLYNKKEINNNNKINIINNFI